MDCARCQRLRDRVEELEALLGLKDDFPPEFPIKHHRMRQLLGMLREGKPVSKAKFFTAMYGNRIECDQPKHEKIVEVYLTRLRGELRPLGIEIDNLFARGWFLSAANKQKLEAEVAKWAAQ